MQQQLGDQEATRLFSALTETEAPTSIRLNPIKAFDESCDICSSIAGALGLNLSSQDLQTVPWCNHAYYLPNRPQFTLDPHLHAGCYYVQEASSMFIAHAWKTICDTGLPELSGYEDEHRLLDLCAAPGGKSTLWRSLIPQDWLLVANEPNRQRAEILNENLQKWGYGNVLVTNTFADNISHIAQGAFDVVAADVPCSGEGMFRKDPASREEWSIDNVMKCAALQRSIITDIWAAIKPGGFLIYSTCTYNHYEDEDNVAWIINELEAKSIPIPTDPSWGIVPADAGGIPLGYHFYQHRAHGEGFFLALLQKPLHQTTGRRRAPQWLKLPHFDWSPSLQKGKKTIPCHIQAMLPFLAQNYPQCELSREQALQYLRRESITIEAPRGHVIVYYEGHPLGFVNNLGSRANNMYPAEWRIRHL